MDNRWEQLKSMLQEQQSQNQGQSLMSQVKSGQAYDLLIALETIKSLYPDMEIDADTYEDIKAIVDAFNTQAQQHVDAIHNMAATSRNQIVAALSKSTNIFVSPSTTDTISSSVASKTLVNKLPGDYIRAHKKEFLVYVAGLIRKTYDIKNIQSLKPSRNDFENKDITIEYNNFVYTKDAKNLFNNIANILKLGNMNLGKVLETIEAASPSGAEIVTVPKTSAASANTSTDVNPNQKLDTTKEKIFRQFSVFEEVMKDKEKLLAFKKIILDAIQEKMSPEDPASYDLTAIEEKDFATIIDIEYDGIKFQGSIKTILVGLAKGVYYMSTNIDKATHYLMDKTWTAKPKGPKAKTKEVVIASTSTGTIENEDAQQAKAGRILDVVMDPEYHFPTDFASRLSELVGDNPNRFQDYINKGVTMIKSVLAPMAGKNIEKYVTTALRLYLPGNGMIQDTTIGQFLKTIAYIKYNTLDIHQVALELFPVTDPAQPKVEPKPQPKSKLIEENSGPKATPITLPHVNKFQEIMIHHYTELCIAAKKSCNNQEERPQKYTEIIAMLDVITASIEAIKESINPKNFAAARRTINGYKNMQETTVSSLFNKEANACFMIKAINEKLTTKDHSKL